MVKLRVLPQQVQVDPVGIGVQNELSCIATLCYVVPNVNGDQWYSPRSLRLTAGAAIRSTGL
jgi:hypothetical protein